MSPVFAARLISLTALATFCACASAPSPDVPTYVRTDPPPSHSGCSPSATPERWAVIVGVDRYRDRRIAALSGAVGDAWAFYHTLASPSGMAIHPSRLKLLLGREATLSSVREALGTFLSSACPQDQIVVFFAGHGVTEPGRPNEGFLLMWDTDVDELVGSSLSMHRLPDFLAWRASRAGRLLLIVDACHAGGVQLPGARGATTTGRPRLGEESFAGAFEGRPGWGAFSAATLNQSALEQSAAVASGCQLGGAPYPGGLFTCHLIRGLSGSADTDGDSEVTWGELREHVIDAVTRDSKGLQSPMTSGQIEEGMMLARIPDVPLTIPEVPALYSEDRDKDSLRPWGWGGLAVAGASVLMGAIFHVLANEAARDINNQTAEAPGERSRAQVDRLLEDQSRLVTASQIGYGVALAFGAAGLALFSLDGQTGVEGVEDVYRKGPWLLIEIGATPQGAIGTVSIPWP